MSEQHSEKRIMEPAIRFKGFTDSWEQRKAGKLFLSVVKRNKPELPVLSATQEQGMIFRNEVGSDIQTSSSSLRSYKVVEPGDFVIHLRSFQGGFAFSRVLGITSAAYTVLRLVEDNTQHTIYWKCVFSSSLFVKRLETVTYGIRDGRSISYGDFSTLILTFPNKPEQQKIGSLFEQLDTTLTLQQRKFFSTKHLCAKG